MNFFRKFHISFLYTFRGKSNIYILPSSFIEVGRIFPDKSSNNYLKTLVLRDDYNRCEEEKQY